MGSESVPQVQDCISQGEAKDWLEGKQDTALIFLGCLGSALLHGFVPSDLIYSWWSIRKVLMLASDVCLLVPLLFFPSCLYF